MGWGYMMSALISLLDSYIFELVVQIEIVQLNAGLALVTHLQQIVALGFRIVGWKIVEVEIDWAVVYFVQNC